MASIPEVIAIAVQHHQAGRLQAAEQIYRQILAIDPNHIDALHLLGVVVHQIDKRKDAIDYIRRSIELNGNEASFHNSLGNTLKAHGRLEEAAAAYRRAIDLKPDYAEAHAHLGNTFRSMGKLHEAAAAYDRARELKPDFPDLHVNVGNLLMDQEKFEQAVAAYRRAVELKPTFVEAHNNLGTALKHLGQYDAAVDSIQRALEFNPRFAEAYYNLGNVYYDQQKLAEAADSYTRAVEINPHLAKAQFNRACTWLLAGKWDLGLPAYEWRWQEQGATPRAFAQPLWDGSPLAGKTILLHAEQGLGDTIQFIRFALILKRLGATVVAECQKPLLRLLADSPGFDKLVARGEPLPAFDVHAPFMSVPGILRTSKETVPADIPYVRAQTALIDQWRTRLAPLGGYKVGIHWQGNSQCTYDRVRSIPLCSFAPLAELPGVRLFSLQKGEGSDQLNAIQGQFSVMDLASELDLQSGPFMDTAAVMKSLDLIISCDSVTAHLAGALGVPVWLALPFVPYWYWLLDRSDTPWYPTMRLFRQREPRNWTGVFEEMKLALRERLAS